MLRCRRGLRIIAHARATVRRWRRTPSFVESPRMRSLSALDHRLLVAARTRGHGPQRDRAILIYSRLGEHAACWLALGAVGAALDTQRRAAWARGAAVVAGAYAVNYAVKLAVRRSRPQLDGLPPLSPVVSSLSFPSAHATTSFAAARVYGALVAPGPLYAAALAFGVTRPYLGVHYPSDVVAGALLGTLIGVCVPGGEPRCR
jgi:decaprenylphosphoryl-5-phosphoribose phosphatase